MLDALMTQTHTRAWVRAQRALTDFIPMPKPTTLMGPGSAVQMCDHIAELGFARVLLVTDKDLTALNLYGKMQERLEKRGVEVAIFDAILPDPTVDQVMAGLAAYNRERCEAIVAVGGGSVLDAAKLISIAKTNDKPLLEMAGFLKVRQAGVPLFVVPTTAGTGSEATIAAVVSDSATHRKTAVMDLKLVPMMAALDADLMLGLPRGTTIFTAVDAMTHAIESFLSVNHADESDRYAVAALTMVEKNLPQVLKTPTKKKARQELAIAAYYAGVAFTRANLGYVHAIAHRFGGHYGVPHGKANAIVLPHVLDLMVERNTARLAALSRRMGKAGTTDTERQAARAYADFISGFLGELEIPTTMAQMTRADIPTIAREALEEAHGVIHYPVAFYLDQKGCEELVARMLP